MVGFILLAAEVIAGIILIPFLVLLILRIAGFSAAGPVAGSLAAGIQSGIGNVVAGSLFAMTQAFTMGARIPGLPQLIVCAIVGSAVVLFVLWAWPQLASEWPPSVPWEWPSSGEWTWPPSIEWTWPPSISWPPPHPDVVVN